MLMTLLPGRKTSSTAVWPIVKRSSFGHELGASNVGLGRVLQKFVTDVGQQTSNLISVWGRSSGNIMLALNFEKNFHGDVDRSL